MKRLRLVTLLALLALALVFRPDPRGPEAASPGPAPDPVSTLPVAVTQRQSGSSLPAADGSLDARVALESGNRLLDRASQCDGPLAATLLDLAVEQFRACLSHERKGSDLALFQKARAGLQTIKGLKMPTATAQAEIKPEALPPPTPAAPKPEPKPQVATLTTEEPPLAPAPLPETSVATEPLMVGPDGVIYRRVNKTVP